jgi:heptosyltransferase I
VPLPADATAYAARVIPDQQPTLLISPCSSHTMRNWRAEYYAQVADHAASALGHAGGAVRGTDAARARHGDRMLAASQGPLMDQIGRDTLPQMLALLARATVLLTPDSGPAHMATMVDTPVIGLYAPTNPARSGPYKSRAGASAASRRRRAGFKGREPGALPWWVKIEKPSGSWTSSSRRT